MVQQQSRLSLFVAAALVCATTACPVPFASEEEAALRFELGELGECSGQGEQTNESGTVIYAYAASGESCVITLDWSGVILDAAQVREQVNAEIASNGLDPDNVSVSITKAELDVYDLALRDAEGNDVGPNTVESVTAEVSLENGEALFSFSGENIALDAASVENVQSDAFLAELQQAYDEERTARGMATAVLTVPMSAIAELAAADSPAIEVRVTATLDAEGTQNFFGGYAS